MITTNRKQRSSWCGQKSPALLHDFMHCWSIAEDVIVEFSIERVTVENTLLMYQHLAWMVLTLLLFGFFKQEFSTVWLFGKILDMTGTLWWDRNRAVHKPVSQTPVTWSNVMSETRVGQKAISLSWCCSKWFSNLMNHQAYLVVWPFVKYVMTWCNMLCVVGCIYLILRPHNYHILIYETLELPVDVLSFCYDYMFIILYITLFFEKNGKGSYRTAQHINTVKLLDALYLNSMQWSNSRSLGEMKVEHRQVS